MDPCTFTLLSLDEFLKKQALVDAFVQLFIAVYKEAWGEDWTDKEVLKTLHPRAGYKRSWVCLMLQQNAVRGFAYASVVRFSSIQEIPKHFSKGKEEKIALVRTTQQAMQAQLGAEAASLLLHFKELAVAREHRGTLHKLRNLVSPIILQAEKQGARIGVIRTSKKSPMYNIAKNLLAGQDVFLYPDQDNVLMMGALVAARANLDRKR